jgi:nucleoside-diphosphate-sugar epimerase
MSFVVVTGADGFIGTELTASLRAHGHQVRRAVRSPGSDDGDDVHVTGDIAEFGNWPALVQGAYAVVHLAGRAHITDRNEAGTVARFRPTNVDASLRLAEACRLSGVRRMVFVSSIGVNGEGGVRPYTETDAPAPVEAYAYSKLEAEQGLARVLKDSGTELVIVRPSLVYGPGAKGNVLRLLRLVARGVPLPLGSLRAPRSLIGVRNLCQMLVACVEHPGAAGQLFLAAEPERQSTASLVSALSSRIPGAGKVWKCPVSLLAFASAMVGKSAEFRKIAGSFEVDASKAAHLLDWYPAVTFDAEMDRTVAWFLRSAK